MTAAALSSLFLLALCAHLLLKAVLMWRQIRHVRAHRGAVPAAFAGRIGLDAHRKAADYTVARMRMGLAEVLTGSLFVLALTLGGGLQALIEGWSGALTQDSLAHGVAVLASIGILSWLIDQPFALLRIFGIERRFGFNRMTPHLYIADTLREALLAAVLGLPILAAVLWLMAAMGEYWWLWVWAFWLGVNLLALLIWPNFIAPLFNSFKPLEDENLRGRVEALLRRCGFRAGGLFVMDGSRRSAHGNAYFTGFGASRRIVFFDTLLEKLAGQEVEAVLAHELGHFHHHHIVKRIAMMALCSLALLGTLGWLMQQSWFQPGLGVSSASTASALALFALALPVLLFPLAPLASHWSRMHEFEADAYAARQTRAADLVNALVKLYRDNAATLTPDPLYSRFFDSHPPAAVRIARLQT